MTHDSAANAPTAFAPGSFPRSVRDAWHANLEVDRALVAHLTPVMFDARTPGRGMTVAEQLGHLLGCTVEWGARLDPDGTTPCATLATALENEAHTDYRALRGPSEAAELVPRVAAAALAAAEAAPAGSPDSPHRDAASYLIHMMVHHAHHRGQIVLALKAAGHPLPDEDSLWIPWRSGGPMAYGG